MPYDNRSRQSIKPNEVILIFRSLCQYKRKVEYPALNEKSGVDQHKIRNRTGDQYDLDRCR